MSVSTQENRIQFILPKSQCPRLVQDNFNVGIAVACFPTNLFWIHVGRVHLKIKPFQCEHCKKSFYQKGNMKTHVKTVHSKEKPYECEKCGKSFAQKINTNLLSCRC